VAVVEGTGVKLTPMLAQYLRLKEQHRDAVLMFRLGDFYEMFFEDAQRASAILDITLTARNKSDPHPIPLCGVPFHAVDGYIQKLLAAGLKVAICEQVEDPKGAKGLVDRDVVRVITPGTVLEEENLDPRSASFLAVVARSADGFGLAACDLSTGEVRVMEFSPAAGRESGATTDAPTHLADDETLDAVAEELARLGAKELVVAPELQSVLPRLMDKLEKCGASKPIVGLVVPAGYSFNLDGTAIYLTMAAVFVAQATNTPLDLPHQLILLGILLLTSKGAAGVTGSGFIVLAATLDAVGASGGAHVPAAGLAIIFGIDRFMSEARALTNVCGNSVATLVVAKWCNELDTAKLKQELG